jgi:hypothetical protein
LAISEVHNLQHKEGGNVGFALLKVVRMEDRSELELKPSCFKDFRGFQGLEHEFGTLLALMNDGWWFRAAF